MRYKDICDSCETMLHGNSNFFENLYKKDKSLAQSFVDAIKNNEYKSPANVLNYKSNQKFYDVIVTLFPMTKEEIKALVKNDDNIVFTPNYKKGVPQVTSGKYLPSVLNDTPFYEDIITDSNKNSNTYLQQKETIEKLGLNNEHIRNQDRDYSVEPEQYGDMETAQRMVDEAQLKKAAAGNACDSFCNYSAILISTGNQINLLR